MSLGNLEMFLKIPSASLESCEDQQLKLLAQPYRKLSMRNIAVRGQLHVGSRSLNQNLAS